MWDLGAVNWPEQLIQFVLIIGPIGFGWWAGWRRRQRLERWSIELFTSATQLGAAAAMTTPPDPGFTEQLGQTIRERLADAQDALGLQAYSRLEPGRARGSRPRAGAGPEKGPTELLTLILSQLDAKLALPTDPMYGDTLLLAYGVGAYLDLLLGHSGDGSQAAETAGMIYANPRGDLAVFKALVDCSPQRVRDAVLSSPAA